MKKSLKLPPDLLIMLLWTLLTYIFVLTPFLSETFLRMILGIPMVLFIPGYVLIAALFPKRDDLESLERIALSFGLSIAVVPILGLLLNFTLGIRLVPALFALCFYTAALIVIAAYRREILPEEERFRVNFKYIYEIIENEFSAPGSRTDIILSSILIFSIAIAIGMVVFVITTPKIGERFTEFYILGPQGKAENYPSELRYMAPASILVGVVNHEYATVNYTVRFAFDGELLTDTRFTLEHNKTWERNITFAPDRAGMGIKLAFWLFKEENFSEPYRELHLWVNVSQPVAENPAPTPAKEVLPIGKEILFKLDDRRGFILFNHTAGNATEISRGDKVVWSNEREVPVTLLSDIPGFDAKVLDYNKRTSYVFTEPGTFHFYLENDRNLSITIIVKP